MLLHYAQPATEQEVDGSSEKLRQALFNGRPTLVVEGSPSNPLSHDSATDPHKLFQLLRRKKKQPHSHLQPARYVSSTVPEPPTTEVASRPTFSARPLSPTQRPLTRDIRSAQLGPYGRPCTRQKHPKMSLDLFPASHSKSDDHFPKPHTATLRHTKSMRAPPLPTRR